MTFAARMSLAGLIAALVVLGLLRQPDERQLSGTTFGTVPAGYRGAYDLLAALHLPVQRAVVPAARLEPAATVWWIEPHGLCGGETSGEGLNASPASMAGAAWPGRAWVEGGAVAVVMLPQGGSPCPSVAGIALPARNDLAAPLDGTRAAADGERIRFRWFDLDGEAVEQLIDGPVQLRPVRTTPMRTFADAGDWTVSARVDGRPFVIERAVGRGRLVVIADPAPLQNAWLGALDAAPWMLDLVRAFGVPHFDEYAHGLRTEGSVAWFLARSPAAWLFAGLAVLGAIVVWRGAMLPPRTPGQEDTAAPVLDPFVDALAALYARSRDYEPVAQRYRALAAAHLCRQAGLPAETSRTALVERLRAVRPGIRERPELLLDTGRVGSERELRLLVRDLDALTRECP